MSESTMTFSGGSWNPATGAWTAGAWPNGSAASAITINRPQYGYTAEIHMPIETTRDQTGAWHFFDNGGGGEFDYRLCTMTLDLPAGQKQALNDFIRLDTQGRALPFMLSIDTGLTGAVGGDTADGFYPFGPDLYAVGNPSTGDPYSCIVQPVVHDQGGALWQPFRWFTDKLTLLLVSPVSALPLNSLCSTGGLSQGPLRFTTVSAEEWYSGFMFPQDGFKPKTAYNYQVGTSLAGIPNVVDAETDYYETTFDLAANLGNAALLVNRLTAVIRKAPFSFSTGSATEAYPFGADFAQGSSPYTVNLLGSDRKDNEIVLKITHESYNRFQIPLNLYKAA